MLRFLYPREEIFRKDIIEKGPPKIRILFEKEKQKDYLPKEPFSIYDMKGNDCKLYFESEGIYIKYKGKENESRKSNENDERIFYPEILSFHFEPASGFENFYVNLLLNTKLGKRVYYFIPLEYSKIISNIFKEEA